MRIALGQAVLGLGLLAGPADAADLDQVKAHGALRVIVAADESAETFALTAGPDPGFERELLESFARLQGLNLQVITAQGYADRIPMLLRGDGDLIVAIFDTEDRRKQVDFTSEVMPTHNVVVTMKPAAVVADAAALKSMTAVGAIKGAKPADEAVAAGLPSSALRLYETRDALLGALRAKQVAAVVLPVSELALAGREFQGLQAGATVGAPGRIAWAVRKGDDALQRALDEHIANVRRGPTWGRLVVKYFGNQTLSVLGRAR